MTEAADMINHPPHYQGARWESIEIIEALGNQFRLGNALKYIFRHKKKGGDEDLRKARWYLEREFGQKTFSRSDSFNFLFWRDHHARDFAESFGIEDMHLIGAVSAISLAHYWIWERDATAWRESVHNALTHLNAYLVPVDLNPELQATA